MLYCHYVQTMSIKTCRTCLAQMKTKLISASSSTSETTTTLADDVQWPVIHEQWNKPIYHITVNFIVWFCAVYVMFWVWRKTEHEYSCNPVGVSANLNNLQVYQALMHTARHTCLFRCGGTHCRYSFINKLKEFVSHLSAECYRPSLTLTIHN